MKWYVPVVLVVKRESKESAEAHAKHLIDGLVNLDPVGLMGRVVTGNMPASPASDRWFLKEQAMILEGGEFFVEEDIL